MSVRTEFSSNAFHYNFCTWFSWITWVHVKHVIYILMRWNFAALHAFAKEITTGKSAKIITKPDLIFAKIRGKIKKSGKVLFESLAMLLTYPKDSFVCKNWQNFNRVCDVSFTLAFSPDDILVKIILLIFVLFK